MEGKKKTWGRLRRWELALLLGLGFAALVGPWLGRQQDALADKVVRLHVVANSDSDADQALKLRVRDAVLAQTTPVLEGLDRSEALEALTDALPAIGEAAAEVVTREGYDYPVKVSVSEDWFPTRDYTDFSLPAGSYTALRVELGKARGKNWWCVVFPPLCLGSVTEQASQAGLTDEELALITGETGGYIIRFQAIEWWEQLKRCFE